MPFASSQLCKPMQLIRSDVWYAGAGLDLIGLLKVYYLPPSSPHNPHPTGYVKVNRPPDALLVSENTC